MPYKDPEANRKAKAEHYQNNKDKYRKRLQERTKVIRDWCNELKAKLKCNRCPESHHACLHFHHTGNKTITIAEATRRRWSIKRTLKEMEKCEVLCANCHAKEHYKVAVHTPEDLAY